MDKQLRLILASLKYQVEVMKQRGEIMDKSSWLMKMGVILSGEDAEILIEYLQNSIIPNSIK